VLVTEVEAEDLAEHASSLGWLLVGEAVELDAALLR
jgi:hypothetical protein